MTGKPMPTALKILRGNPGGRKLNTREPKPQLGATFPAWLDCLGDPTYRQVWDDLAGRLEAIKVLTEADAEALAQLVHKLCLYRTAAQALTTGCSYQTVTETGAIMHRQKPEYTIVSDLGKQIRGLLSDFGLTPSSRSKVQMVGTADDSLGEFLYGQ